MSGLLCEVCIKFVEHIGVYIISEAVDCFFKTMSNQSIDTIGTLSDDLTDENALKRNYFPYIQESADIIFSVPTSNPNVGTIYKITGTLLRSCERFSCNFLSSGGKDIALHFNPRPLQNYIVRNSKISGSWGIEENFSQFSSEYNLFRGFDFELDFLIAEESFWITVNKKVFCEFKHRINSKKINSIEVKGDVRNVSVKEYSTDDYSQKFEAQNISYFCSNDSDSKSINFNIPFSRKIPNGVLKNDVINIVGKVKMLPNAFTINLQDNMNVWPHPDIALHLNIRFNQGGGKVILCLNSWTQGKWLKEQRTQLDSKQLSPGRKFKISIEVSFESFLIHINDSIFSEFSYRCEPSMIKFIKTFGDLNLDDVWVSKKEI